MFAVVKTGGKQYKVSPGDVLLVEKLEGEAGTAIRFSDILMYGDEHGATVGAPVVANAAVNATIREQTRGDKIIVFKKKRRQGYRRTAGHRQDLTVLTIEEIIVDGKSVAKNTKPSVVKAAAVKADVSAEPVKAAPVKAKAVAKPASKEVKAEAVEKAPAKKAPAKKATDAAAKPVKKTKE